LVQGEMLRRDILVGCRRDLEADDEAMDHSQRLLKQPGPESGCRGRRHLIASQYVDTGCVFQVHG
jgi:hypothetical protein